MGSPLRPLVRAEGCTIPLLSLAVACKVNLHPAPSDEGELEGRVH
jgi:hypothetical protein